MSSSGLGGGTGDSTDVAKGVASIVRKKRGPNSVTSNACTSCKRAKAKVRPDDVEGFGNRARNG